MNKKDVIKIGNYLYKNYHLDNIGLNRKHIKYIEICNNLVRKKNYTEKTCPYCNLKGKGPNMGRYHFKNCKLNPNNQLYNKQKK